ncbi:MAG TPA: MazG family protein [Actinotalea sp.]
MSTAAELAELVAVMDRLRSPGGCPWDAEQTHASLVPFAIEEVYEVAEAVETGDREGLREELGDLLLQVVFHARIAEEHPTEPFTLGDVAAGTAEKLRRRHPHVFADATVRDAEHQTRRWDEIKKAEKDRSSALDGIPAALPALARAQAVLARGRRASLDVGSATAPDGSVVASAGGAPADEVAVGQELLEVVRRAELAGVDADAALRRAVRELEERVRTSERRA